jgi:hypothetical protein
MLKQAGCGIAECSYEWYNVARGKSGPPRIKGPREPGQRRKSAGMKRRGVITRGNTDTSDTTSDQCGTGEDVRAIHLFGGNMKYFFIGIVFSLWIWQDYLVDAACNLFRMAL